jgi:hypothetical protein
MKEIGSFLKELYDKSEKKNREDTIIYFKNHKDEFDQITYLTKEKIDELFNAYKKISPYRWGANYLPSFGETPSDNLLEDINKINGSVALKTKAEKEYRIADCVKNYINNELNQANCGFCIELIREITTLKNTSLTLQEEHFNKYKEKKEIIKNNESQLRNSCRF